MLGGATQAMPGCIAEERQHRRWLRAAATLRVDGLLPKAREPASKPRDSTDESVMQKAGRAARIHFLAAC